MGLARGLERRLERLVDGLAARLFGGRVHPVELGSRLVREADLAVFETAAGPGAPNGYRVALGGEPVDDEVLWAVRRELEEFVEAAAAERGWRLEGPARVVIAVDPRERASRVDIETWVEPGACAPWAVLEPVAGHRPAEGVTKNRTVVGRAADCDVRLAHDDVSRRHALMWREAGSAWIADLGSSNGTHVNGERLTEPVQVRDGDRVAFGSSEFLVRHEP